MNTATRCATLSLAGAVAVIGLMSAHVAPPVSAASQTAASPMKGALAGRYFWRPSTIANAPNLGIGFYDSKWAYRGLREGGQARCTRTTARGSGQGCLRYSFNKRTGKLTVGGKRGSYRKGDLVFDGLGYLEVATPKPGSSLFTSVTSIRIFGICPTCSSSTSNLAMDRKRGFVLSRSSITTGADGVGFAGVSPSERGTYDILSGGRLRLAFADGTVRVRTLGINLDERGRPDAQREGVLLDGLYYFIPS